MRIKTLFFLLLALVFGAAEARAQTGTPKPPSSLNTEVNALWPDNVVNAITPFGARQTLLDVIASAGNTSASNIWTGPQTLTQPGAQFGILGACNTTWLFGYTDPCGAYMIVYGPLGTGAQALANRSSDFNNLTAPVVDLITSQIYAVHDNTANTGYQNLWGSYWLAQRKAGAYAAPTIFGLEASFVNFGANVQSNPYAVSQTGRNVIMRLDSGVGSGPTPNILTAAIEVVNNGSTSYTALNVTENALSVSNSGFYEAIQLASNIPGSSGPGDTIAWWSDGTTISGLVEVDNGSVMHLFGRNGIITVSPFASLTNTAPSSTAALPFSFSSTASFGVWFGTGAPTQSAAQGSLYLRNDGGAGTLLYANTNGTTGWAPIPTGVGVSQTCTPSGTAGRTLIFTLGILTGGTCNT